MEITYKNWEKDTGLEELQAKIFNTNNPNQPQPVKAADILDRFEREKIDPKTVITADREIKVMKKQRKKHGKFIR